MSNASPPPGRSTLCGLAALSPLLLFLCLYLVTSIVLHDFYAVPITVAFLISSIYALLAMRGSISERVTVFARGAGSNDVMLMLMIFILAGAFAASAKSMGAVDATVNLTLRLLPERLLLPGIFIAACFISMAIGTSVGTIAALTPVAVGIAQQVDLSTPFVVAIVLGGAYFGDNLSFISDTTIAATTSQGCRMSDKFRANLRIVLPMAVLVLIVYAWMGRHVHPTADIPTVSLWKVLPYLLVLLTAVLGVNVMLVLIGGIVLTGFIGILDGSYDLFGWFAAMADGMMNMSELIIMTLLAGGMLAIIQHNGGVLFIIQALTRRVKGKRGAELTIALLIALVNVCTANNTVAIITTGSIAADISRRYGIDPRRAASILDTMSCCVQGLLPYGAQMLIAAGLAALNPLDIFPFLYYPIAIGIGTFIAIALDKQKPSAVGAAQRG